MSMKLKKNVKKLLADDTTQGTDITGLKTDVGNLKTAVGSKDTDAGSLKKRCADIETAIGSSTSGSETGIHKDIVDINTAIGDDATANTILGRIKALEDAAKGGDS